MRSIYYRILNTIIDNHIYKCILSFTLFFISSYLCNSYKYLVLLLYMLHKKHGKCTINRQNKQNSCAVFDKLKPVRFSEIPHINSRLKSKSVYAAFSREIGVYAVLLIRIIIYFLSSSKVHKMD
nr:MAG TPA: hypothetical protein [Caudoviricetes sp.]